MSLQTNEVLENDAKLVICVDATLKRVQVNTMPTDYVK